MDQKKLMHYIESKDEDRKRVRANYEIETLQN